MLTYWTAGIIEWYLSRLRENFRRTQRELEENSKRTRRELNEELPKFSRRSRGRASEGVLIGSRSISMIAKGRFWIAISNFEFPIPNSNSDFLTLKNFQAPKFENLVQTHSQHRPNWQPQRVPHTAKPARKPPLLQFESFRIRSDNTV